MTDGEERLRALVRDCAWFMAVLAVVRDAGLPDAWVGAGALRDLVWGELSGVGFRPDEVRDIDVVYFDPADLSRARDDASGTGAWTCAVASAVIASRSNGREPVRSSKPTTPSA